MISPPQQRIFTAEAVVGSGEPTRQVKETSDHINWNLLAHVDSAGTVSLRCFNYFARRMNDLTQKNDGIRGKVSEVERDN